LLQFARQADDPWYIAYQDESTQWYSQRMDLEEKVANLGDELACKNLMIFELKRTVKKRKEEFRAYSDQIHINLPNQVGLEFKSYIRMYRDTSRKWRSFF
jgi:predicted  nucleic acid-binding Zn-ribbon protein